MAIPKRPYELFIASAWGVVPHLQHFEDYLTSLPTFDRGAANLLAAHCCFAEVCNGGFEQFFSNSTGTMAPEAFEGLLVSGQAEAANLLRQAMRAFDEPYPRDTLLRQEAVDAMPDEQFETWMSLSKQLCRIMSMDEFATAADRYASNQQNGH